ncbi:hypothetical protein MKK58_14325 [Methylobacterium sp. J-078]|uniref:hypothetical protein n=1 Tax=Methylobacterium sp. J-078 TaxID=2836657 RepID=UPI001FBB7960|nr:hypothetical protein [Methylobacterium sp. J-078]MCJ2045695.1 hypothetical protein [Methylobacterium sp. J-078]
MDASDERDGPRPTLLTKTTSGADGAVQRVEGAHAPGGAVPPAGHPPDFHRLVFQQELNEVYLLLDFVSGRPDKHFADLNGKIADPAHDGASMTTSEVIQRVSSLRYPPDKPERENAQDAAFLLLVKDALNVLAYPARGMTIAYTTMFMEDPSEVATNRVEAARTAYPSLYASATAFRKIKDRLAWLGLIVTVLSAILLWQVTYGAQLAARFDEAKRNDTLTAAKVHEELNKQRSARKDTPYDLQRVCNLRSDRKDTSDDERDSTIQQLCGEYAYRHAQLCVAVADVGQYSQYWLFRVATALLPMHDPEPALSCGAGVDDSPDPGKRGRQEDAQSIAGVLTMMSNYLLPILFGLVGTLAALVRGVQDKVTDSLLSPRDRTLAFIRLPLGMVAGVCVGLFLSPENVAARTAGGIGSFTISASGIAFLAGYGAEAFFRALDGLLGRVFSFGGSQSAAQK